MREQAMTVQAGGAALAGTLALPEGDEPFPACLLLNGSGPLDRDSNTDGQDLNIANALAAALADAGVASLRIDKRGVGESSGEYLTASFDDEVADAAAALDALRARAETNGRVGVIGHSVGATIAIRLARHATPPDAFALLAGAAQRGDRVMAWQTQRIGETLPAPARWFRSRFERKQSIDREQLRSSTTSTIELRGQTLPAAWFRGYMAYDPADDLPAIDRPVLAITGEKDIQVDPADVATIGRLVTGPFDGDTPADLTHLLRSDSGPAGVRRYPAQLKRPADGALIDRVAAWAAAQLRGGFACR